jgi:uncharacterized repeat protein (TIGR01451 family)
MKRLVLRVVALGVVVVLGVIAIAHAQRATDRPSPSSDSGFAADAAGAGEGSRPRTLSAASTGNPLRGAQRVAPIDQTAPPATQIPPSIEIGGMPANRLASYETTVMPAADKPAAPPADTAVAPADERGATRPPADPFGLRSARGNDPAMPPNGQAAMRGDTIPDARDVPDLTSGRPAPQDNRAADARALAAPGQQPADPGLPAGVNRPPVDRYAATARGTDRYGAAANTANRYGTAARGGVDSEEPAPLRADPLAAPTTPLNSPGTLPAGNVVAGNFPAGNVPGDNLSVDKVPGGRAAAPNATPPTDLAPYGAAAANRVAAPFADPAGAMPTEEGSGQPGEKHLEGPQTPQLTLQKIAPAEIQVGKPATFRVVVRNTGTVPASAVEIHDQIPKGTRVAGTLPQASRGVRGELVWTLGTIKPGDEAAVEVQLMPLAEGEIGSVATVLFNADASARCVATRPQLVVEMSAAEKVLIGEPVTLAITVSNPGTGIATGVVVEEHIPAGLQQPDHPNEPGLQYEVGDLRPGESRKLELALVAKQAGPVTNVLVVHGEGNLRAEGRCNLEVIAPQLDIALEGPKKRYLEREATYQVSLRNPGTAPAERVELVAYLPSGLKFVSANNSGQYDEANRAVFWRLEELPVNGAGTVELVTLPVEAGQHNIKLLSTASKGLKVEKEQPVIIDGIAAILFQASSSVNPVEVGGETTYEIHVINQGSKAATNVRLAITLPPEMKPMAAEGPSRNLVEGGRVSFDGLARLAPKGDMTYRVRAQALRPGDLRTRIQLMTDEMTTPVTKEESTRVYADE